MTFEITEHKRCQVLKMTGRIDSSNADDLHEQFKNIQGDTHNIVFDMCDINFLSSRGWWVLIETQKAVKGRNGELLLVNVAENILDSLDLIGMREYFQVHDELATAVGSF